MFFTFINKCQTVGGGVLFYKNASFSLCISQKWPLLINSFYTFFLWHCFLRCHVSLVPQEPAPKMGTKSIFSNIVVRPLFGKIISNRFKKTWETEVNKGPEVYIYVQDWPFSVLYSLLCGEVSQHLLRMCFFSNYVYLHCIWNPLFIPIKCTPKENDTESSVFHIKLLKHHG